MCDAIGDKKRLECKIFTAIISEKGYDFCGKIIFNYTLKINKALIDVRFSTQRIELDILSKVVDKNDIVVETIKMNESTKHRNK